MRITLYLTRQNQLELMIVTDKFNNNPNWALDWVKKNQPDSFGARGIWDTDGSAVIQNDKITSFLNAYIEHPDDKTIKCIPRMDDDQIHYKAYFGIGSIDCAKKLCSQIKPFLEAGGIITPQLFYSIRSIHEKDAVLKRFFKEHEREYAQDKKKSCGFFSCFRKTEIQGDWTLREILEHAKEHNNRSRKVFVNLGWMTSNGSLTDAAPNSIKNEYPYDENSALLENNKM